MKTIRFIALLLSLQGTCGAQTLLPVPLVRQATSYSCGPAALLSVLYYWNVYSNGEQSLYAPLQTTEEHGTTLVSMEKFARSLNLSTQLKEGTTLLEIEEALKKREPVIVDFQAWPDKPVANFKNQWEDGHYAVVVGVDTEYIYFMDPSQLTSYSYLTRQDFLERWHDYEIVSGKKIHYHQLALFIGGKKPLLQFPSTLQKIE